MIPKISRRHGWQLPLHPLQVIGMAVYSFLVAAFYSFLAPFIGNRIAYITLLSVFTSLAFSAAILFIRCVATDPSDKTRKNKNKTKKKKKNINYGFLLGHLIVTVFRRMERRILKSCIRRKYLLHSRIHLQPLLTFPLVTKDDYEHLQLEDDNLSFCSLCNYQVHKHSKHCRTCNRCVQGFDHHCRWLNNCVGKRNYTTFILLMISVLLMLLVEAGTAITVSVRCLADKTGIEQEILREFHHKFPRGLLIAFSVMLFLLTAYGSAALGQLFFFHVVLIRKGMRTYDYILAMKEANQFNVSYPFSESEYSSDDSSEPASPTPMLMSQFVCSGERMITLNHTQLIFQSPERLTVKIDTESTHNQTFRPSIDPWKLIQISKEKAFKATEKTKEKLAKEKQIVEHNVLNPLPSEMKSGPLVKPVNLAPLISERRFLGSPRRLSSPRRRFSNSPSVSGGLANHKYRNNFDLKITEVSRDLESHISRQVLCSIVKDGSEASPR